MLKYYTEPLYINGKKENTKRGRVVPHSRVTWDELIRRMSYRGTSLTKTDIVASMNCLVEEIEYAVSRGESISSPLFNLDYSIKGIFDPYYKDFDPRKHTLSLNLNASDRLKELKNNIVLQKAPHRQLPLMIDSIIDTITERQNTTLTPGGGAKLIGENIKIVGDPNLAGIFFKNKATLEEIFVKRNFIVENNPSCIHFIIPSLYSGIWNVGVRTFYSKSNGTRKNRVSTLLNVPLKVVV